MFLKTCMENGNRGRPNLEDRSCECSQSALRVIQLRKVGGHLWFPFIVNFLRNYDFFFENLKISVYFKPQIESFINSMKKKILFVCSSTDFVDGLLCKDFGDLL